jgi:hypothetical protein
MSSSASQVKAALGTALATVTGLRAFDYQPDQVNPPLAWPILDSVEYHGAMGSGLITYQFRVPVIVGRASEKTAQKRLDEYVSFDNGIRSALEADLTLGGVAQSLIVESAGKFNSLDANDTTYLMVEFRVIVYA